jgi:hypothetical protein
VQIPQPGVDVASMEIVEVVNNNQTVLLTVPPAGAGEAEGTDDSEQTRRGSARTYTVQAAHNCMNSLTAECLATAGIGCSSLCLDSIQAGEHSQFWAEGCLPKAGHAPVWVLDGHFHSEMALMGQCLAFLVVVLELKVQVAPEVVEATCCCA